MFIFLKYTKKILKKNMLLEKWVTLITVECQLSYKTTLTVYFIHQNIKQLILYFKIIFNIFLYKNKKKDLNLKTLIHIIDKEKKNVILFFSKPWDILTRIFLYITHGLSGTYYIQVKCLPRDNKQTCVFTWAYKRR